jgi:hypothetical protein
MNAAKETDLRQAPWTVEELIRKAERVIASNPKLFGEQGGGSGKELNVRLIRDYVVREFIPRPERAGREARFGLDHLVQLLAVRLLLRNQKWSLPAIKSGFAQTSTEELLGSLLLPVRPMVEAEFRRAIGARSGALLSTETVQTPKLNPAQLLIEQFKTAKKPERGEPAPLADMVSRSVSSSANQSSTATAKLHIGLEPWCEVVVDAGRAKSLSSREIERLGEALKARLRQSTGQ